MFWGVLDGHRQSVLRQLCAASPVPEAYLAGGTAVALQLGHRESIDFDFFSHEDVHPDEVANMLQTQGLLSVTGTRKGTFHGIWNRVQVTWLHYPYPLIHPALCVHEIPGLQMASLVDIALMKLVAVSQRGARKDFIDLYAIAGQGHSLAGLLRLMPQKFPDANMNFYHIVKSLIYFEDAEREPEPRMLQPIRWEAVKSYFLSEQRTLLEALP